MNAVNLKELAHAVADLRHCYSVGTLSAHDKGLVSSAIVRLERVLDNYGSDAVTEGWLIGLGGGRWNAFPGSDPAEPRIVSFGNLQFFPLRDGAGWAVTWALGKGRGLAKLCEVSDRAQVRKLLIGLGKLKEDR